MATDEVLLKSVVENPDHAVFRTYAWSIPTLSLGYFQSAQELVLEARWKQVPVVRRLTGGGALWHHHEITYALVLPTSHPMSGRGGQLYRSVHAVIAAVLEEHGVDVHRRGEYNTPTNLNRPFLCFADRDAEDLVVGNSKVVGSAQRRRAGAVLQHGSLLLDRSETTPELPGLQQLGQATTSAVNWSQLIRDRILEVFNLEPNFSLLSDSERQQIQKKAEDVYSSPSWTNRR